MLAQAPTSAGHGELWILARSKERTDFDQPQVNHRSQILVPKGERGMNMIPL